MGIKSTKFVSREFAITRILFVETLLKAKNYIALEKITNEHDISMTSFVKNYEPIDSDIEMWTDEMLGDKLDEPFFRESIFDNYLIGEPE